MKLLELLTSIAIRAEFDYYHYDFLMDFLCLSSLSLESPSNKEEQNLVRKEKRKHIDLSIKTIHNKDVNETTRMKEIIRNNRKRNYHLREPPPKPLDPPPPLDDPLPSRDLPKNFLSGLGTSN